MSTGNPRFLLLHAGEPDSAKVRAELERTLGLFFHQQHEGSVALLGQHPEWRDVAHPGRAARLLLMPANALREEAAPKALALEAALQLGDGDALAALLSPLGWTLLHRPTAESLADARRAALAEDAPLAPPPGLTVAAQRSGPEAPVQPQVTPAAETETRYNRGLRQLTAIHGDHGQNVIRTLEAFSPEMGRFILEFPFSEIYTRPGLDLRSRQIATMASLITLGHGMPELKSHIRGSLNIGITRQEIIELILQMTVYAGFPAAITALRAARETFEQLDRPAAK